MLSVTPPSEYSHVDNPVFVIARASTPAATIFLDIIHHGEIIYAGSALASSGVQRFNISDILKPLVQVPLPWPPPDNILSGILNHSSSYRFELREVVDNTVIDSYASPNLIAVAGGVPAVEFMELSLAGTDIFAKRLLNPSANRFLLARAKATDSEITLYTNEPGLLFFLAKAGETLNLSFTGGNYNFTITYPALYLLNLNAITALNPQLSTLNSILVRFGVGREITIRRVAPLSSWKIRTWLFRNQWSVFEPITTTGRAQEFATRPANTARRCLPEIDDFRSIDLPSEPVSTMKLSSGYQLQKYYMELFKNFALSDIVFLVAAGGVLVYYMVKPASRLFSDDENAPAPIDIDLEQSVRKPDAPVYGDENTVFYIDPAESIFGWQPGELLLRVVSLFDGAPTGWTIEYTPATPEGNALHAAVTKIDNETIKVVYPVNQSIFWHSGTITATQESSGAKAVSALRQNGNGNVLTVSPDIFQVTFEPGTSGCVVTAVAEGVPVDWFATVIQGSDWCTAEKISQTELRITRLKNDSNTNRLALIAVRVDGDLFLNPVHNVEFTQLANPVPENIYEFALDTSGIVRKLPDGDYECNIPATGNGTIVIPVTSTVNGNACVWSIDTQLPGLNAVNSSGNLSITPNDNTSEAPRSFGIRLRQAGSDKNFTFAAHQDGKETPNYSFRIEGENMQFSGTAASEQSLHIVSSSGSQYADWEITQIQFIDGGTGWLSAIRNGEYLKVNTLSANSTGTRRFATVHIQQIGSGLVEARSVIQDHASVYVFSINPNRDDVVFSAQTVVTSTVDGVFTPFTVKPIAEVFEQYVTDIYVFENNVTIYLEENLTGNNRSIIIEFRQTESNRRDVFNINQLPN